MIRGPKRNLKTNENEVYFPLQQVPYDTGASALAKRLINRFQLFVASVFLLETVLFLLLGEKLAEEFHAVVMVLCALFYFAGWAWAYSNQNSKPLPLFLALFTLAPGTGFLATIIFPGLVFGYLLIRFIKWNNNRENQKQWVRLPKSRSQALSFRVYALWFLFMLLTETRTFALDDNILLGTHIGFAVLFSALYLYGWASSFLQKNTQASSLLLFAALFFAILFFLGYRLSHDGLFFLPYLMPVFLLYPILFVIKAIRSKHQAMRTPENAEPKLF
jgi:hypothetical protein